MRFSNETMLCCAVGCALWAADAAHAGPLAPTKPTQAITVLAQTTSAVCPPGGPGKSVDIKQNPDGSTEPFTIPPKTVFVVTRVDATLSGTPSRTLVGGLYIFGAGPAPSFVTFVPLPTDADGHATGTVTIPSGVPVKPGATLCFLPTPTESVSSAAAIVHGFFAKDK